MLGKGPEQPAAKNITKVSFGARQTLDLHGQPGRVTADDCDARSGQGRRLRKRLILSAVKHKAQQVIKVGSPAKETARYGLELRSTT